MKVEKHDAKKGKMILAAMIVDKNVLSQIVLLWKKEGLFATEWENLVAGWCVRHYTKYERAPKDDIMGHYAAWSAKNQTKKEMIKLVEAFLNGMANHPKPGSSKFVIDRAGEYFNEVRASKLSEEIQGFLDKGEIDNAVKQIEGFNKLELGLGSGVDVFQDKGAMEAAFAQSSEELIEYPNDMGVFLKDVFARGTLVSFMAPEKRGKTFWLTDVAWMALMNRRKVAMFQMGDMSEAQVYHRLMARVCGRPFKPQKIRIPKDITFNPGDERAWVEHYTEIDYKEKIDPKVAWEHLQKIVTEKIKSKDSYFKLSCHPTSTVSISGINSILQGWERRGWVPDVIVIDYADIIAPMNGAADTRDQINQTWAAMRALSQRTDTCVVTATQTDAASYEADLLRRSNFTEDKRKLAHVTAMIGINQTEEEKQQQIQRLNFVALRDREYSESWCIHVAGFMGIGRPWIKSTL